MTSTLEELAVRVEGAAAMQDDGGLQLDGDIAKVIGWTYRYREGSHTWGWCRPGNDTHFDSLPPGFSHSLDAALKLVPKDRLRIDMSTGDKFMWAVIYTGAGQFRGEASSLALALTAAALRSRAELARKG
jgi:hypothetical protein